VVDTAFQLVISFKIRRYPISYYVVASALFATGTSAALFLLIVENTR